MQQNAPKDFFISYTSLDRQWAEWIAFLLEQAGFSVFIQAWDFRPGSNFVLDMDNASQLAHRTLAILSPNYLQSDYCMAEWSVAFRRDPTGKLGLLLPVRIQKCDVEGLPGPLVYIDLVDLDEAAAQEKLLAGIAQTRAKPSTAPRFPGQAQPAEREAPPFPGTFPPIWNVPSQRNPFFTGREQVLAQLHDTLGAGKAAALTQPQAISGLGGIGKTQTAVEYAYRFASEYDAVLWTKAETRETLNADFVTIAALLNLPEKDEQEQSLAVVAVKRWLTQNARWLLILDNADDLLLAREFIPPASKGHILLTTRAHSTGDIAQRVEIEKMEPEEGSLFLLRRVGLISSAASLENASEADRTKAKELVQLMDGLPLALDQAGAYIEETMSGLHGYLQLYRAQGAQLLKERGGLVTDHPDPVATTWSLSFEKVERTNPAAAELLRFCAFLAPDAIPEELFAESTADLGSTLEPVASDPSRFNAAIRELLKYSLVHRDPETNTLSIHRLVQEVLKDQMDEETQRRWAERAVRAVSGVFPFPEYTNWDICRRLLLHAQACSALIEEWELLFTEAAGLLNNLGYYLMQRGEYEQVESLHQRALAISELAMGSEHPDTASSLWHLAFFYNSHGKYKEAEFLYKRALFIYEKVLGPDHTETAGSLNELAVLYQRLGKIELAESLYQRSLAIFEKALGPNHTDTATSLNNLAELYRIQGEYELAEPLFQRALAIRERVLGPDHPDTANSLNNLAALYDNRENYEQAELLYQRALSICERNLGPDHPDTATCLNNLAGLYYYQRKYKQAERLYQRALSIYEKVLGRHHFDTAQSLINLALVYYNQKKYKQTEPLYQRALPICERVLGFDHPYTTALYANYNILLQQMKRKT